MSKLIEGMQANDLDFLIMPLISIDEYESKIDDRRAVVIGFYVTDNDPASELSAFIEKGTVPVLDTEVSPAPTEDGYYMVFVEMDRNEKLPEAIMELIDSVDLLTNVDEWQFSPYHSKDDENYPLTAKELKAHINCDPKSIEVRNDEEDDDEPTESVVEFMKGSLVEGYSVLGDLLTLKFNGNKRRYIIKQLGEGEPDMALSAPIIGAHGLHESTKLQSVLGQDYQVYSAKSDMLVLNGSRYMLLKAID